MFHDVLTYSPEDVFLTFGGFVVEGWESIKITRTTDGYKTVKGIRGKNTRVRDRNTHSIIEIVCPQTSMTNKVLSAIEALDAETEGVRLELTLSDTTGWEVFSSDEAYVKSLKERVYEKDLSARNWQIECLSARWNDSKRGTLGGDIFSAISGLF